MNQKKPEHKNGNRTDNMFEPEPDSKSELKKVKQLFQFLSVSAKASRAQPARFKRQVEKYSLASDSVNK